MRWRTLRPYLLLALLWAVYFHPLLLNPGGVLYADFSDFLAEHLPAKLFLNREWRATGELPLWNPYHFCGTPFVHDIQVGCFYPPYAVMYLVPAAMVGAALSWVIALHVLAAGAFVHAYARSNELGEAGSLVAAVGFMLSAKWMTHLLLAGHTVTVGLAWLPLVLLGLERGTRTGRAWPAVGAGVAFALLTLGTHPQWTFYAGVFAAAWTFAAADRTRAGVRRWLASGLGAVAVALPLAAVQLLPTLEAGGQSARTVGLTSTESLSVGFFTLFGMVGPSAGYDPPATWEMRALYGVYWLAAAVAAPVVAGGRARWWAWVFAGVVAFSLGGAALVEWLPGFNLFRVPARMLLVGTFPLALLAGATTDALARCAWSADRRAALRRGLLAVLLFAALPAVTCHVFSRGAKDPVPICGEFVAYWCVVAVALPVVFWLVLSNRTGSATRTRVWVVILVAELVAPVAALPAVRPQADIYPDSALLAYLREQAPPGEGRVLDIDTGTGPRDRYGPLGGGSPLALTAGVETARGYNPLDVRHYREFVGFVVDNDEQVLALSPVAQPILPNFVVTNRPLFDLLNVRAVASPVGVLGDPSGWATGPTFPNPPAVPALPPQRPDPLPPVTVYENRRARPRAFVVPEAARMPAGEELAALKATDFGRTVLLTTADPLPPNGARPGATARVTEYRPNRVTVRLDARPEAAFLVLSDVWFPGWVCRVDGAAVPVYRANHAFRAVALPPGAQEAVFAFAPRSYLVGWWVSAAALLLLVVMVVVRGVARRESPCGPAGDAVSHS